MGDFMAELAAARAKLSKSEKRPPVPEEITETILNDDNYRELVEACNMDRWYHLLGEYTVDAGDPSVMIQMSPEAVEGLKGLFEAIRVQGDDDDSRDTVPFGEYAEQFAQAPSRHPEPCPLP